MCVKREFTEDVSVHVLQRLNNMVKAGLPESLVSSGGTAHSSAARLDTGVINSHQFDVC